MDRVLVALVGGLQNKYIGEAFKPRQPGSWFRLPERIFTEQFAKREDVRTIKDIEDAVGGQLREEMPTKEIHFMPVRYNGRLNIGILSRRSPESLAEHINHQIEDRYTSLKHLSKSGDTISLVLLTFSAGALLAQQAMLVGLRKQSHDSDQAPWPRMVKTIVILSGITKGWQFTTATPAPLRFLGQAVRFLAPMNMLIWKLYRGSPFVVSTRLAFYDAFSPKEQLARTDRWKPPRSIFFLGSKDEYVTPSDCLELDPGLEPVYIEIPHATHGEMLNNAGKKNTLVPRLITEAITTTFADNTATKHSTEWTSHAADLSDIDDYLDPLDLKDDHKPDSDVEHVVIVMHGIRDNGFWAKRIAREIKTLYRTKHPDDTSRRLRTVTPTYGFFSMWDFLFPGGRTKALYWFLDKYADIRRLYPRAQKIDLIAHSNGTYLGAQALLNCEKVRFRRMLFAGSVVRRDFWMQRIEGLSQRLEAFHNFIGREDLVVALLPGAMETIPLLNKLLNVGGAGAFGFKQLPQLGDHEQASLREPTLLERLGFGAAQRQASGEGPRTASQRMIQGGHGAAIQEDCWKTIARFIVEETINMEEVLNSTDRENPRHPLRKVARGSASTIMLTLARVSIGALIVPLLLFLLLFPLWYPFLVLSGFVPALTLPLIGPFPLMIPSLIYVVLFVLVWILRNGLRYL